MFLLEAHAQSIEVIHAEAGCCKHAATTGVVTVRQAGQRSAVDEVPEVVVEPAATTFHPGPFSLAAANCAQVGLVVTVRGTALERIDADVGGYGLTVEGIDKLVGLKNEYGG